MRIKQLIIGLILVTSTMIQNPLYADDADFSVRAPSGQMLYYKKLQPASAHKVSLWAPSTRGWGNKTKPSGDVVVPSTVTYGGVVYSVVEMLNPFKSCPNVTSVTLPEGIERCPGYVAFKGCRNLEEVTLPSTLTNLYASVFDSCPALERILVNSGGSTFKSVDGVLLSANGDELVKYPCNKNPGSADFLRTLAGASYGGLKKIGGSAFAWNNHIEEIVIPYSVRYVGGNAFVYCKKLRNVDLGDGVEKVGAGCFTNCNVLQMVTFGCSVDSIGMMPFRYSPNVVCVKLKPYDPPTTVNQIPNGVTEQPLIIVPCGRLAVYKTALNDNYYHFNFSEEFVYEWETGGTTGGNYSTTQMPTCTNGRMLKAQATPYSGYRFARWEIVHADGNIDYSHTTPTLTLEVTCSLTATAVFQRTGNNALEEVNGSGYAVRTGRGSIRIEGTGGPVCVRVCDVQGREVYAGQINGTAHIDVPGTGLYLLQIDGRRAEKLLIM